MLILFFALSLVLLASLPVALVWRNLAIYQTATQTAAPADTAVSVLIPARNEAEGIATTLHHVLSNRHPSFEVLVLDDHSTDGTADIVAEIAAHDERLTVHTSQPLPDGWNGKQYACWQLAQLSQADRLLFIDADVRMQPDCLERIIAEMDQLAVDLLSGFPRQEMDSLSEKLLIPMMHFILLGYLPFDRMRAQNLPAMGVGCGQLFLADRESYFACNGHRSIRSSRHDGLKLPRSFRTAGLRTDLFDASDICTVRMYQGWQEVVRGLLKNASEGIASPKLIPVFSLLLLGGAVLPVLSFAHAIYHGWFTQSNLLAAAGVLCGAATLLSYVPAYLIARRFHHSLASVLLHPLSVLIFVGIQWLAFMRTILGLKPVAWRGRN